MSMRYMQRNARVSVGEGAGYAQQPQKGLRYSARTSVSSTTSAAINSCDMSQQNLRNHLQTMGQMRAASQVHTAFNALTLQTQPDLPPSLSVNLNLLQLETLVNRGGAARLRGLRSAYEPRQLVAPLLRAAQRVEGRVHDALQRLRQLRAQPLDGSRWRPCWPRE